MPNRGRLRLFDDDAEAWAAVARSAAGEDLEVHRIGARRLLKKPGQPNIEPRYYLCDDGHWRKWDNCSELVAITEQAVRNDRFRAS